MNKEQLLLGYTYATVCNTKQDGSLEREKNKIHMNQLMSMSVNLLDKEMVKKIAKFLLDLPKESKESLAHYLQGDSLKNRDKNVNKILGNLSRMIINHNTHNPALKELLYDYKNNVLEMAEHKEKLMGLSRLNAVHEGMLKMDELYKKNGALLEKLNVVKKELQGDHKRSSGNSMSLSGNGMNLSGNGMSLSGNGMSLSGNGMSLSGNGMSLSGNGNSF